MWLSSNIARTDKVVRSALVAPSRYLASGAAYSYLWNRFSIRKRKRKKKELNQLLEKAWREFAEVEKMMEN